jgi:hypothetical protein
MATSQHHQRKDHTMNTTTATNDLTTRTATGTQLASIGDRVNVSGYSDTNPATIIAVSKSGKVVTVRMDRAEKGDWQPNWVAGGFAGTMINQSQQEWNIFEDPNGHTRKFSLRNSGNWVEVGSGMRDGARLKQGWAKYYDFNF